MKELFALFGQPIFSGDDMNIIQVGRSAVSRYHQTRRFFEEGLGDDQGTHDFAVSELGVKMGGCMLLQWGVIPTCAGPDLVHSREHNREVQKVCIITRLAIHTHTHASHTHTRTQ